MAWVRVRRPTGYKPYSILQPQRPPTLTNVTFIFQNIQQYSKETQLRNECTYHRYTSRNNNVQQHLLLYNGLPFLFMSYTAKLGPFFGFFFFFTFVVLSSTAFLPSLSYSMSYLKYCHSGYPEHISSGRDFQWDEGIHSNTLLFLFCRPGDCMNNITPRRLHQGAAGSSLKMVQRV